MFWKDKRIIVTGGEGFLGKHVCKKLEEAGCTRVFVPRSCAYDLREQADVRRLFLDFPADYVIHLAANFGGIQANLANPGRFFYDNAQMGLVLMEEARRHKVRRFVGVSSVCAYPEHAAVPFKEDAIWDGYPEPSNGAYGIAKKLLLVQGLAYKEQYNFDAVTLFMTNVYGPGDHFFSERAHFVSAAIGKIMNSSLEWQTFTGDGSPTRDFLYVDDAAEAILAAVERGNPLFPMNIGTGREISIKDAAALIKAETGYKGELRWTGWPNGQARRAVDIGRAKEMMGWEPKVTFEEGIKRTVEWFKARDLREPYEF